MELALVSVTLNGDSFLARKEPAGGTSEAASVGVFLGGVAGMFLRGDAAVRLTTAEEIKCPPGSLLTFRLDQAISLAGTHR